MPASPPSTAMRSSYFLVPEEPPSADTTCSLQEQGGKWAAIAAHSYYHLYKTRVCLNSPTIRHFNCFQRNGSLESCGIKWGSFQWEVSCLRTGVPEKCQVSLISAGRVDPGNKLGTNARWKTLAKQGLKLLTPNE